MRTQKRQVQFAFDLWVSEGSWFWHLLSLSDSRGIVGAAPSANEAARDACASLEEIDPHHSVARMTPMLLESALTWSRALEGFGRATVSTR
jgi:hypothetical protein